jgi:macrolide transport system ATP-binding/permease protein
MKHFMNVENLSFTYESNIEPLFQDSSFQIEQGWCAIVGANGSGKTTLLKLMCGLLTPDSGSLSVPGATYYAEQRTDSPPHGFHAFFESTEKQAYKIKKSMQILDHWRDDWNVLSHGERKRCQIAAALYQEPLILAIDEPSNHLDLRSKKVLLNALKSFRGIGLLVSHDRELMDQLCQRTIFIHPPHIEVRKCSYSVAALEIERETKSRNEKHELAKREVKKLKKKVTRQREKASRADKLRSKRNLNPKDHDAKSKKDLARLTGKDSVDGRAQNRLQSRLDHAQSQQAGMTFKKSYAQGITFDVEEASRLFPLIIPAHTFFLGENKALKTPELTVQFGDKIGLIGDNGAGKSTFLRHMMEMTTLPSERVIYIPQEIPTDNSKAVLHRISEYSSDKKGLIMSLIRRLGSDPTHVLATTVPTPGEVRKLLLAEGLLLNPSIIIMDEPTNHMDLSSIECIEEALKECACAQLLVSHDMAFLKKTVGHYWAFEESGENEYRIAARFANADSL